MARVAGLAYLLIFVGAGLSYGYVHTQLLVPGDTAATAGNIAVSGNMLSWCVSGSLIAFACDIIVAAIFYLLLKPSGKLLSLLGAFFRLVQTAVLGFNLIFLLAVVLLIKQPQLLGGIAPDAMYSLLLHLYESGFDVAMVFFGLHCVVVAWLMLRSPLFPQWLGILVLLAGATYLLDSFSKFLLPSLVSITANVVGITAVVAELSLCVWLLVKGVKEKSQLPALAQ